MFQTFPTPYLSCWEKLRLLSCIAFRAAHDRTLRRSLRFYIGTVLQASVYHTQGSLMLPHLTLHPWPSWSSLLQFLSSVTPVYPCLTLMPVSGILSTCNFSILTRDNSYGGETISNSRRRPNDIWFLWVTYLFPRFYAHHHVYSNQFGSRGATNPLQRTL